MNKFDNIVVNIEELFRKNYYIDNKFLNKNFLVKIFKRYLIGFLLFINVYDRLINSGFLLKWFTEFRLYWSKVLEGRPIYFHDFHYLLGIYRQKFQNVETPENSSTEDFLKSWQNKDTIYQLFSAVRRFSYEPLHCYKYEPYIKNGNKLLEYGCGIAPITYSLQNFSLKKSLNYNIADIKQINSHFAKWRLGDKVNYIEIEPHKNALVKYEENFDAVFLITVMEHLPDPLNVVQNIHKSLKKNGFLLFDYILSNGEHQDTIEAVKQRQDVLSFIEKNFELIKGKLSRESTINFAVVKKK